MGPRSIDRGNPVRTTVRQHPGMASMGPRSIDRGNFCVCLKCPVVCRRFNGAAVDRPRKSAGKGLVSYSLAIASMGPRSIDRGNESGSSAIASLTVWLQWGRGRSTAEMGHVRPSSAISPRASMGPRSIDRGNTPRNTSRNRSASLLQWGRGRSTAEIRERRPMTYAEYGLQWGRGRSTAEIC